MTSLLLLFFIAASVAAAAPVEEIHENQLKMTQEVETGSTIPGTAGDSSMSDTSYESSTDREDLEARNAAAAWPSSERKSRLMPSMTKEPKFHTVENPMPAQGSKQSKLLQKKGRNHKAIFVDYPFVPRISNMPNFDSYDELEGERRTLAGGGQRKEYQESDIYYIRLPPTPYMFVPGLGYVSQPPTYSTGHLRPPITHLRPQMNPYRPQNVYDSPLNEINPFINLPVDFVSNGKPTGVYQWQSPSYKPIKRPESQVTTLDKGPYFFNGRPHSIYLLRPDARPPIHHQNLQFPDYQDTNLYY